MLVVRVQACGRAKLVKRWDPGVPLRAVAEFPAAIGAVLAGTRLPPTSENADAIVILGATVLPNGEASGSLRARVEAAAALFFADRAPLVVATGAHHRQPPGEAVVSRQLLVELGVPHYRILIEEKSRNTSGNLLFARGLLPTAQRIIVVTEPFHMARGLFYARIHGFPEALAHPVPSPAWNRPWDRVRLTLRDCFSMAIARGEHKIGPPE